MQGTSFPVTFTIHIRATQDDIRVYPFKPKVILNIYNRTKPIIKQFCLRPRNVLVKGRLSIYSMKRSRMQSVSGEVLFSQNIPTLCICLVSLLYMIPHNPKNPCFAFLISFVSDFTHSLFLFSFF